MGTLDLSVVDAQQMPQDAVPGEMFARVVALGELVDTLGKEEPVREHLIDELLATQTETAEALIEAPSRTAADAVHKLMLWAYEEADIDRPEEELTLAERAGLAALADLRRILITQEPAEGCAFRRAA